MKKLLLSAVLISINAITFSQSTWVTKKIDVNLSIEFPKEPKSDYDESKRATIYVVKQDNTACMFTVLVRANAMTNYDELLKLSVDERNDRIRTFLYQGILQFIGNSAIIDAITTKKINGYIEKDITYSHVDDRFNTIIYYSKFIFIDNRLYIIQCSVRNINNCDIEKNYFLNSIKTN